MKFFINIITLISSLTLCIHKGISSEKRIINTIDKLPLSAKSKKAVSRYRIITIVEINDAKNKLGKKTQNLNFKASALHKKLCSRVIPELFHYENYKNNIEMIKESKYDDSQGRIWIKLIAPIIKTQFILNFKIPRINSTGSYPFLFDRGFLLGLKGYIHVYKKGPRCLLFAEANWDGPHTGYPNLIFEAFSKTAADLFIKKIFRLSGSLNK